MSKQLQLMIEELIALYGEPRCVDLHHKKEYQHGYYEPCPVEKRINELVSLLTNTQ